MRITRYIVPFFITLFFAVLLFGIFISRIDIQLRTDIPTQHSKFFDYRGITHAMTNYSQGSSPPAEMFAEAEKANVDFLYITDFNDFDPLHEIYGYNNDVLVFTGKKVSYLDSHFLLFSQNSMAKISSLGAAQAATNDILNRLPSDSDPMVLVMAHPFKQGYEWSGPYPEGLGGIEVMNLRHMWQQNWLYKKASFTWSLFLYIFNPKVALLRLIYSPSKELQLWDTLSQKNKTLGLMGNHATGKIFSAGFLSVSFPTYEDSFRFVSNHVLLTSELTGIASRDREKIHNALTQGNFYMSVDALANPMGFAAYMNDRGQDYMMGETVPRSSDLKLRVDLPALYVKSFETKLYKDGREILASREQKTEWEIKEPGVYRVYVRLRLQLPIPGELRWVPWIYTNNFYVR